MSRLTKAHDEVPSFSLSHQSHMAANLDVFTYL